MKKLFLGFVFLLASTTAQAATYYIDLDAGSDANPGTIGSPYLSCTPLEGVSAIAVNDIVYIKKGTVSVEETGICHFRSTGTSGNYITVDAYSSGTNPTFWGNDTYTAGWTLNSGNIYRTTASITWGNVGAVSVDDTSALNESGSFAALEAGTYYFNSSTDIVYVWLLDGTTPADNTMRIARWNAGGNPAAWGAFTFYGGGGGNYIRIKNIIYNLANEIFAFRAAGTSNEYEGCTAKFNSREGFHFGKNGVSPSTGGQYGRLTNCYTSYGNGRGVGYGQGVTTEAPYCVFLDTTSEYNFMANFDLLDFNVNTNVHSCVILRCVSKQGGQDVNAGFTDPGIYVDGGYNNTIIKNTVSGQGLRFTGAPACSGGECFGDGIRLGNENPTTETVSNINIVDNLSYANTGTAIRIEVDAATYEIGGTRIIGNTLMRGSGSAFNTLQPSDLGSVATNFYNNIMYCQSSTCVRSIATADSADWKADFNVYYNTSGDNKYQVASTTYSFASWQALEAEDASSLSANPLFVDSSVTAPNVRLQSISEGYGANSPAINLADETKWDPTTMATYALYTIIEGTTRIDNAMDSSASLDTGYHYYVSDPPDPAPPLELTSTNVEPGSIVRSTVSTVTVSFTTQTALPATGKIVVTFPTSLGAGYVLNSGGTGVAGGLSGLDGTLSAGVAGTTATFTRGGGATSSAAGAKSFTYTFVKNPDVAGSTGVYSIKTTDTNDLILDQDLAVTADTIIDPPASSTTITFGGCTVNGITRA